MIKFNRYYRLNAVLKKAQLYSPPVISLPDAGLPFNVALHFTSTDGEILGIQNTNPVLRGLPKLTKIITAFPIPDQTLIPGKVIMKPVRLNDTVSKYMRTVPGWKRMDLEPSHALIKENVVVYNYGMYYRATAFQTSALAEYHSFLGYWNNIFAVVKKNLTSDPKIKIKKEPRHQVIMVPCPEIIPGPKKLINYSNDNTNTGFVFALGTSERWFIGEIWKWIGGGDTIFNRLSEDDLKHTSILFTRVSSGTLVNLYVLRKFLKASNGDRTKPEELFTGQDFNQLVDINLQKAILMMFVSLKTKVDSGIVSEVLTEEELDGRGQKEADEEDYKNLEASILNDEGDDAPTEKAITQQFLADSTDTGQQIDGIFKKKERSGIATRLMEAAAKKSDQPSSELEDIFTEENIPDSELDRDKAIDDTLAILDDVDAIAEEEKEIPDFTSVPESDITEEDAVSKAFKDVEHKAYVTEDQDPEKCFLRLVEEEAAQGNLSAAEVRRFEAIAAKYRTTLKNPYGGEGTLASAAHIAPEDLMIPENNKLADKIPGVFNDSYLESSHDKMHRHYNTHILKKDVMSNAIQLMKAGYAIDSYEIHPHNDVVDNYETHTVRLVPIRGKPSTIKFRVPVVTPNGSFKAGGNLNRMRVQRADIPIRKVSPGEVALTSYHSKMWVRRSPLVAFNFDKWIEKTITSAATNPDKLLITNVSYGDCFNSEIDAPLTYSAISRYFASFTIGKYNFMWDSRKNASFFGEEVNNVAKQYANEQVMVGKGDKSILWMDYSGTIFEAPMSGKDNAIPLGKITDLIGIDPYKIPVQSADLKIFSKSIPIGIALAYWVGLGNLLKTINAKYRRVYGRELLNLQPNEFYVKFKNETLVFDRNDEVTSLIMAGWNEYHAFIKFYSPLDFDKKDTFGRFFYETKIEGRYENELTIIRQLWIDPITEGELIRLKEPTDMVNLFISAVKKLTYDKHPDPMDGLYQRDRGYERISGFVYDNMVRSVRGHRNRRFMKDASIDMQPDIVWYDILKDQTTGIVESSNPIHSLKEQEVVVFRGAGGRSSQSMMANSRKAHRSNVGRDSEATVDSGDVATVIYTTANPNYDSVRGTVRYTEKPNENTSRAFGTSQLLAAAAEYDD